MGKQLEPGEARSSGTSVQEYFERDTREVTPHLREASYAYRGSEDIDRERYYSRAFFDLEVERMWSRTWQMACRVEDIPDVGDFSVYNIVHESLISRWPTLRKWLEEGQEDSAFLEQLRTTAKQWDRGGRPVGLLWRAEAMEEARRFDRRYKGELASRERDYLEEVMRLATRAGRTKRIFGNFGVAPRTCAIQDRARDSYFGPE